MSSHVDDVINRLSEVGGLDEVAELCSEAKAHLIRLRDKCNMQATILQSLTPERYPDVLFIHAHLGMKDQNGMPERLLIVPAYGCDFSYVYNRTGETTGPQW